MNPVPIIVFILVVFTVVFCVVKEVKFTIPKTSISLTLDYAVPPLLGVLVLLASGALTPIDVFNGGLVGDDRIQPFAIMIIFNGLAYLCICIDLTGLLAWIALHVAGRAGSSAFRLFGYFFLLSAIFTVFTSNDIVILTLTPIIYYCSRATNMDPLPFLFGEFFAANICSLVLLIGNPTNIIVGEANHLTFADYSMWMVAPAFVATATAFLGCWIKYRRELEQTFIPPVLDPASAFKDKRAAVFHSAVLILTLLLLSLSPFIGARMWVICAVSAGVIFLYNLVFWPWDSTNAVVESPQQINTSAGKSYQSLGDSEKPLNGKGNSHSPASFGDKHSSKNGSDWAVSDKSRDKLLSVKEDGFLPSETTVMVATDGSLTDSEAARMIPKESPLGVQLPPCLKTSLLGLPWRIVPFVFGMFVLVEGLYKGGWIDTIADFLIDNIPQGAGAGAVCVSSFLMVSVTILLCNLINNQPATILLTRVIINDKFMALPKAVRSVGMFAVILGSNLGANFTLIGALAGIMWAKILAEKNLSLTYLDFAKLGFTIMPIVTFLSAGLLFLEHLL